MRVLALVRSADKCWHGREAPHKRGRRYGRILIATARELDATRMTGDRAIIAYGEQGNVRVVVCWRVEVP